MVTVKIPGEWYALTAQNPQQDRSHSHAGSNMVSNYIVAQEGGNCLRNMIPQQHTHETMDFDQQLTGCWYLWPLTSVVMFSVTDLGPG